MKTKDEGFMRLALREAKKSLKNRGIPIGAILVLNNRIVGRGHRDPHNEMFLDHAEMTALRSVLKKYKRAARGLTIYTTLEPCIVCFGAVLHGKIGRVVYALEDPFAGATRIPRMALPERYQKIKPKINKGVLRGEALKLFQEYLKITKDPFWKNKKNSLVKLLY